ncbi:eukaryotic translation initiation factor 2C protein [Dioscorea alata]|uniref:Eukaryotic translation initiation factor 2C protein n=1 Tax=Dioscorea alata TaxID=55571 RepID=A0ACB7VEV8_DIOAL|nr:eukaryotic translation initiation factor 2C protein [Dioscorea alata]
MSSSNAVPEQTGQLQTPGRSKRYPMARPATGSAGQPIKLLSNHFRVVIGCPDAVFYHYNVSIKTEDGHTVEGKGIGRKIIDKLYETYSSELARKSFAYDGEKSFYTVGPLPQNIFEFLVVLEGSSARYRGGTADGGSPSGSGRKRSKCSHLTKTYKVAITYAAKIPMSSIKLALEASESEQAQDAIRVLDIILRQEQAKRGCLLVRQSFFSATNANCTDLGGGVSGCRGFHSSFRATQAGLSLNMDVSTTMVLTPGPVIDFLLANQNVREPRYIDWVKAKRMLRNLRVKTRHTNMEFKIIGLSEMPCNQQLFTMKVRGSSVDGETMEITVDKYFANHHNIELAWSAHVPCLNVGKPKRPNYLPIELCTLVPLQRYTKALSGQQRASLVEKSRQKPLERIRVTSDAVKNNLYDQDPMLASCGISIKKELISLDGRVLTAPVLKVGNVEDCIPRNGRWNFNNKRLYDPVRIGRWAIVNFSARCDLSYISRELINCGRIKGIHIGQPLTLLEEDRRWVRAGPVVRVEKMLDSLAARIKVKPQFILCVLPERKNCDIYGPWKKKNLHDLGVITQCIAPGRINDQYLTNVLLKINAKLGGINSLLAVEHTPCIPLINNIPTIILGMDVSHGSPGRADVPSIAAVVSSRNWPLISRYRASVSTQAPKVEMIDCLYKALPDGKDGGLMRKLFLDFYRTSNYRKPQQIIIFRDGVSESQFDQVLNFELNQIIKAYAGLGGDELPKVTYIVAQKTHHTKLFQDGRHENVPAGTVVDTKVVHPRHYDFYMTAHAGMIGTSRPTHYHVLLDEIGFAVDDLQKLVHSLSYVYQRSTSAVSLVAPIYYAHLAAYQMSQFVKFEDADNSSGNGSNADGNAAVPELPRLHDDVEASMFFC